jgi:hypothetical protein
MERVLVQIADGGQHARIASMTQSATSLNWTELPLALVYAEDIDIFAAKANQSEIDLPKTGTILPYPLRIVSLPREPLRVGDRRMVYRKRRRGEIGMCTTCRYVSAGGYIEEIKIDIGGGHQIHTISMTAEELRPLLKRDNLVELPAMLCFALRDIEIPEGPLATFEDRVDQYLRDIEDPKAWFLRRARPKSGEVPERRKNAQIDDDARIRHWLQRVAHATEPTSMIGADERER